MAYWGTWMESEEVKIWRRGNKPEREAWAGWPRTPPELRRLTYIWKQWFSTPAEELGSDPCPGHTQSNAQKISGAGTQAPVNWGKYSQTWAV